MSKYATYKHGNPAQAGLHFTTSLLRLWSADRFSVGELSAFLDDSEGHRLAQFLQKKTGEVRPARPIFDCEPERFSLNVQLKRVNTPRNTQGRQKGEHHQQPAESPDKRKSYPLKLRVEESDANAPLEEKELQNEKTLTSEHFPAVDESSVLRPKIKEKIDEFLPIGEPEAPHVVRPPLVHSQPMVCLLPVRPLSPARRSGGLGTADRLRRYSLRRLSQLGVGGRRTLLKEFESTLSPPDFAPLVCSTPVCRPQLTSPVTSQAQTTDSAGGDVAPAVGVTFTNADASKSSLSFGLSPLRQKDKELREILENVLEATIQKFHEKENNSNNVHTEPTSPQPLREASCTLRSRHSSVHQIDANTEMPERCPSVASSLHQPNTEVVRTQELLQEAQRVLKVLDSTRLQIPKIVIPVQQTFNGVPPTEATRRVLVHDAAEECRKEDDAADPAEQQPVQQKDGKQTPPSPPRNEKPVSPQLHYEKSQVNKTLSKSKSNTDNVMNEATIQKFHEKENNSNNVHTEPTSPQPLREASCTLRSRHSSVHQIDANTEMPERCPSVASSLHQPNTEVVRTQELLQEAQRVLKVLDSTRLQIPKIVIPVQQTFNGVPPTEATRRVLVHDAAEECRKEDDAADPAEQQPVQQKDGKQTPPSPPRNEKPVSPQLHYEKSQVNKTLSKSKSNTDNVMNGKSSRMDHKSSLPPLSTQIQRHDLSLAEIITVDDDEESNETAPTIASCSRKSGPLNLVAAEPVSVPWPHGPSRNLRRLAGSRRNCYSPYCLKLTSTNTEAGPPPAHPFKIHGHQDANRKEAARKRPLNKAPNIPINGEMFADELKSHLARLTNYEILDLRKRNSIGDVFPMSGRRHSVAAKQQAIERQLQLEEQIQMEILRRNLESNVDGLESIQTEQQVQPQDELPVCNSLAVNTVTSPRNKSLTALIGISAEYNSSLVGERSCDRISFVQSSPNRSKPFKNSRRSKSKNKMPQVVEKYLNVRNKVAKHRPLNKSKRSLYKGHSDAEQEEDGNLSPIPAAPDTSPITSQDVSSPTPLRDALPTPTRHSRSSNSNAKSCEEIILPPVPFMDDAAESAAMSIESDDAIFKKPLLPAPKVRVSSKSKNKRTEKTAASNQLDASELPLLRRSKRVPVPVKNSVVQLIFQKLEEIEARNLANRSKKRSLVSSTANSHLVTASRSHGRGRKPRQGQSSTASDLNLTGDTDASCQATVSVNDGRLPAFAEHQSQELSVIFEPVTELDDVPETYKATSTTAKKTSKQPKKRSPLGKRKGQASTPTSNITQTRLEHSHIKIPPAPVNELNNIFDQLKHASVQNGPTSPSSCIDGTKRTRKVRVRLQRLNLPSSVVPEFVTTSNVNDREPQAADTFSAAPSPSVTMAKAGNRVSLAATRTAANTTLDLLSWLKGVCQNQVSSGHEKMFTDMRCSAAGNLMFSVLEGIDYAFYETDDRASLGYLRFKPRQKKPAKKAKKYHLHFIVLDGEFDIGTDREHGTFNIGDMVAISIGCRYTIENLRDDVGLLMVIKK